MLTETALSNAFTDIKNNKSNKPERNILLDHLWEAADEIRPMIHSRCDMYIESVIGNKTVKCLLDTGAQMSIITYTLVKELGLESYIDTRYKGTIVGVGSGTSHGIIPYIELNIHGAIVPMAFTVYDTKMLGTPIIFGINFMRHYNVMIDIGQLSVTINKNKVPIKYSDNM